MRRHALVTGASSGIGKAIAARLLAEDWSVCALDLGAPTLSHPAFQSHALDLRDEDAIKAVARRMEAPDAIVHAAGYMRVGSLGELDLADGIGMWRLHVAAATALVDCLAPAMTRGGRIVLIGSRTSSGAAGRSQYAATKAALLGLARSWAIELAPRGVTVNVIAPAATDTPFLRDPKRAGSPPRVPPIGRFVEASEVAALTAFLLGDEAGAITGQQIVVCGGSSL